MTLQMHEAETQETASLWYAWGWLDSHPGINEGRRYRYDAHEFASERLRHVEHFESAYAGSLPSIQDAWKRYMQMQDILELL